MNEINSRQEEGRPMLDFSAIRTALIDVDGVLYRGKSVLPGVPPLLNFFEQQGIRYACITNNGSLTPQQYEQKLAGLGIMIGASHILTSALVTSRYLRDNYPRGTPIYAIGMHGLHDALFGDGYFVEQAQQPQVVVLGPDFEVTYEKLKLGALAIRAGAQFVLTNPDYTLPTEAGLIPDAGALAAGLQSATDVAPLVIGKPEPPMFRVALDLLGGAPDTALVIGDRLETDIAGARNAGLSSALVLTGVSRRDDLEPSPHKPDAVYADLPALLAAWQAA
jgi:4-nitrophenyl phosphatase